MNHKVRALVVGDLMLDHYIWGSCDRISPEAPVQVVKINSESTRLGGAGNVVANLISLGASVGVISVLGDDAEAVKVEEILTELGAKTELIIRENNRQTSIKSRVMATNQQVVRIDKESVGAIQSENLLIQGFEKIYQNYDVILLSDYAKGVLTPKICTDLIALANACDIPILIDPKGDDYSKYKNATLITPNKKEAAQAVKFAIKNDDDLQRALEIFKGEFGLKFPLITISEDGIAVLQNSTLHKFPALAKEVFDVTGAGDTVLATLGFMLGAKFDLQRAVETANLAAAVVVAKVGSATATFKEINALKSNEKYGLNAKIKSLDELLSTLNSEGKRVVFTNGCFDILHAGHVSYLAKAREFGDLLIVGLNSDSSVKRLKGQSRPINSQNDRAMVLAGLSAVDFVVIFDEDTPLNLITAIKPDVLVKGADYEGKQVVGSDIVGEVRLVEFLDGKSTTNLIKKIQG